MYSSFQSVGEKLSVRITIGGPKGTCCYNQTGLSIKDKFYAATVEDLKALHDKLSEIFTDK